MRWGWSGGVGCWAGGTRAGGEGRCGGIGFGSEGGSEGRSERLGRYISFSINSNLPSTAITASLRSCARRTGPTSL